VKEGRSSPRLDPNSDMKTLLLTTTLTLVSLAAAPPVAAASPSALAPQQELRQVSGERVTRTRRAVPKGGAVGATHGDTAARKSKKKGAKSSSLAVLARRMGIDTKRLRSEVVRLRRTANPRIAVSRFMARMGDLLPETTAARNAVFRRLATMAGKGKRRAQLMQAFQRTDRSASASGGGASAGNRRGAGGGTSEVNVGPGEFASNPAGGTAQPMTTRGFGIVGWTATDGLADQLQEIGFQDSLYRRTFFLPDPQRGSLIGRDFALASSRGYRTWLTCVGTPMDLSPHPEETGTEYGTGLEAYARYVPTDGVAWADRVLDFIDTIEATPGARVDHVEIWNEVERVEWFSSSLEEFLAFYDAAATRIKTVRPDIEVGGPGLAGWSSTMGGDESVLFALVRHVAESGAPLDFVSWHHYTEANELLASRVVEKLRKLQVSLGLPRFETVVSEWNLYPSAQGEHGYQFDGPWAAAAYAGFSTTAGEMGLDANLFFLDVDEADDGGLTDLAGVGLGAITHHGIRKPVARLMEILLGMARESVVPVEAPLQEYSVRIAATRLGTRVRYVISNAPVSGHWMFVTKSREAGMDPGWLYPIWLAAGGPQATVTTLMAQGLTEQQAEDTLAFIPAVLEADVETAQPTEVVLTLTGTAPVQVTEVRRFTQTVNAPANHLDTLTPQLQLAEDMAREATAIEVADFLTTEGYPTTSDELLGIDQEFKDWADGRGIPFGIQVRAIAMMNQGLFDNRIVQGAWLNTLPETTVLVEDAQSAGVVLDGRKLRLTMEPDSVVVVDVEIY